MRHNRLVVLCQLVAATTVAGLIGWGMIALGLVPRRLFWMYYDLLEALGFDVSAL